MAIVLTDDEKQAVKEGKLSIGDIIKNRGAEVKKEVKVDPEPVDELIKVKNDLKVAYNNYKQLREEYLNIQSMVKANQLKRDEGRKVLGELKEKKKAIIKVREQLERDRKNE